MKLFTEKIIKNIQGSSGLQIFERIFEKKTEKEVPL